MINLHHIVRPAIHSLHPDEYVTLFQFVGTTNVKGRITPNVVSSSGITILAQIQSLGSDELNQRDGVNRTQIDRKAYLYTYTGTGYEPKGIDRIVVRDGDFIQRLDGSWWLISSLMEDFTRSGWVSVGLTKQIVPPAMGA